MGDFCATPFFIMPKTGGETISKNRGPQKRGVRFYLEITERLKKLNFFLFRHPVKTLPTKHFQKNIQKSKGRASKNFFQGAKKTQDFLFKGDPKNFPKKITKTYLGGTEFKKLDV